MCRFLNLPYKRHHATKRQAESRLDITTTDAAHLRRPHVDVEMDELAVFLDQVAYCVSIQEVMRLFFEVQAA